MIDHDWQAILVTGAGVVVLFMVGLMIMFAACVILGREIARRNDEQAEKAISSMPDQALVDAILQFEGR